MTEIAVQSGQCLWGIVRKSFEDKKINANDQDIKNAVDNLVKDNKIENPNLIFAMKNLIWGKLKSLPRPLLIL